MWLKTTMEYILLFTFWWSIFTCAQAFKEMVAMCLVKDQTKRPTAEKLLKHSFFKTAKPPESTMKGMLTDLPPLWERVKALQVTTFLLLFYLKNHNVFHIWQFLHISSLKTQHNWLWRKCLLLSRRHFPWVVILNLHVYILWFCFSLLSCMFKAISHLQLLHKFLSDF